MSGSLYYLNVDFDLSLRRRPRTLRRPAVRKAVKAMSVSGLLRGDEGDAVLVEAGVAEAFPRYLERLDLVLPRIIRRPGTDRSLRLRPFGWSAEAMAMNEEQHEPSPHPPLALVRQVNSRAFSAGLEAAHFDGGDAGRGFSSAGDLQRWLAGEKEREGGWVVKADHGNSGVGNRRLRRRSLSPEDLRFIGGLLEEDDSVTVEPWRERTADLCAVFRLDRHGEAGPVRVHETVYTRDGALIGAVFARGWGEKWRSGMEEAAGIVAGELARRGYFGPVCFDAFVYREGGEERLRPLADLNCREAMSDAVHRLWRERWRDRVLLWRFLTARKMKPGWVERLLAAEEHYDPARRRGVMLAAPWSIDLGSGFVPAPRLAVACVGKDRAEAGAMESSLRTRWER